MKKKILRSSGNNEFDLDYYYGFDIHVPTGTLYIGSSTYDYDGCESGIDHRSSEFLIKGLHILDQKIIDDVANKTTDKILQALSIKEKKLREKAFDDISLQLKEDYKLDTLEPIYSKRDINTAFKKINDFFSNLLSHVSLVND